MIKLTRGYRLDFEGKRSVSDGLKRFITRVLEKDAEKRYTIEQMKKDEWVNEGMHHLSVDMHSHGMRSLGGFSPTSGGHHNRQSKSKFQ